MLKIDNLPRILKKELKSNEKELKSNMQLEHGIWKKELFS